MRIVGKRLCRLLCTMQSKLDAFFAPPGSVRGMRQLDRAAFRRQVMLPAVFLRDATACSKFLRRLQHVVLRYPRIKSVRTTSVGEGGKVRPLKMSCSSCRVVAPSPLGFTWVWPLVTLSIPLSPILWSHLPLPLMHDNPPLVHFHNFPTCNYVPSLLRTHTNFFLLRNTHLGRKTNKFPLYPNHSVCCCTEACVDIT